MNDTLKTNVIFRLTIDNFSSITHADLEIKKYSLIIGPQASGKSVLAKMSYFFADIVSHMVEYASRLESYSQMIESLKDKFESWFPSSAWGNDKFAIEMYNRVFSISIYRGSYGKKNLNKIRISASSEFKNMYSKALYIAEEMSDHDKSMKAKEYWIRGGRYNYDIWSNVRNYLVNVMGKNHIQSQVFIPAGRSFFSTVGRTIMAFERQGSLDPLTIMFGRIYGNAQDEARYSGLEVEPMIGNRDVESLLGGTPRWEGDSFTLVSPDGRIIPPFALSSGQQEILPLITTLNYMEKFRYAANESVKRVFYIEEPEAHLFPAAQSRLMRYLVELANRLGQSLVITTHSPYALSVVNNLIHAYRASRRVKVNKSELSKIIPPSQRVRGQDVSAYAIVDKKLINIVDDNGYIDGYYLDSESDSIIDEFDQISRLMYSNQ